MLASDGAGALPSTPSSRVILLRGWCMPLPCWVVTSWGQHAAVPLLLRAVSMPPFFGGGAEQHLLGHQPCVLHLFCSWRFYLVVCSLSLSPCCRTSFSAVNSTAHCFSTIGSIAACSTGSYTYGWCGTSAGSFGHCAPSHLTPSLAPFTFSGTWPPGSNWL